jgi:hypothetical protein
VRGASERDRLVEEQNRNTVPDLVPKAAALAQQRRLVFAVFQLAFAARTREHSQQLGR